jgi:hypothetical protein
MSTPFDYACLYVKMSNMPVLRIVRANFAPMVSEATADGQQEGPTFL